MLSVEDVPSLADHKVDGDIVFPFSAYVCMAREAFRQSSGSIDREGYLIRHVKVATAMVLDEVKPLESTTTVHTHYASDDADIAEGNTYDFIIASYNGSTWIQHCKGLLEPAHEQVSSFEANVDPLPR
jgi:acyl transferase domain-containing protein